MRPRTPERLAPGSAHESPAMALRPLPQVLVACSAIAAAGRPSLLEPRLPWLRPRAGPRSGQPREVPEPRPVAPNPAPLVLRRSKPRAGATRCAARSPRGSAGRARGEEAARARTRASDGEPDGHRRTSALPQPPFAALNLCASPRRWRTSSPHRSARYRADGSPRRTTPSCPR
jgi:hypothetical protein